MDSKHLYIHAFNTVVRVWVTELVHNKNNKSFWNWKTSNFQATLEDELD